MQRRRFITRTLSATLTGAALTSTVLPGQRAFAAADTATDAAASTPTADTPAAAPVANPSTPPPPVLPARLRSGDTVALIAPATAAFQQDDLDIARETFRFSLLYLAGIFFAMALDRVLLG